MKEKVLGKLKSIFGPKIVELTETYDSTINVLIEGNPNDLLPTLQKILNNIENEIQSIHIYYNHNKNGIQVVMPVSDNVSNYITTKDMSLLVGLSLIFDTKQKLKLGNITLIVSRISDGIRREFINCNHRTIFETITYNGYIRMVYINLLYFSQPKIKKVVIKSILGDLL